jgi:hypothetical protein
MMLLLLRNGNSCHVELPLTRHEAIAQLGTPPGHVSTLVPKLNALLVSDLANSNKVTAERPSDAQTQLPCKRFKL